MRDCPFTCRIARPDRCLAKPGWNSGLRISAFRNEPGPSWRWPIKHPGCPTVRKIVVGIERGALYERIGRCAGVSAAPWMTDVTLRDRGVPPPDHVHFIDCGALRTARDWAESLAASSRPTWSATRQGCTTSFRRRQGVLPVTRPDADDVSWRFAGIGCTLAASS